MDKKLTKMKTELENLANKIEEDYKVFETRRDAILDYITKEMTK